MFIFFQSSDGQHNPPSPTSTISAIAATVLLTIAAYYWWNRKPTQRCDEERRTMEPAREQTTAPTPPPPAAGVMAAVATVTATTVANNSNFTAKAYASKNYIETIRQSITQYTHIEIAANTQEKYKKSECAAKGKNSFYTNQVSPVLTPSMLADAAIKVIEQNEKLGNNLEKTEHNALEEAITRALYQTEIDLFNSCPVDDFSPERFASCFVKELGKKLAELQEPSRHAGPAL